MALQCSWISALSSLKSYTFIWKIYHLKYFLTRLGIEALQSPGSDMNVVLFLKIMHTFYFVCPFYSIACSFIQLNQSCDRKQSIHIVPTCTQCICVASVVAFCRLSLPFGASGGKRKFTCV